MTAEDERWPVTRWQEEPGTSTGERVGRVRSRERAGHWQVPQALASLCGGLSERWSPGPGALWDGTWACWEHVNI